MKLAVIPIKEENADVQSGRFTIIDMDDSTIVVQLAKAAYEDPENFYNENMPWEALEGTEKALEIETTLHVLKALSAFAKGKLLEDIKK